MVAALFHLNIVVVMVINISFVYIQLTQSFTVQIFISVGLVLFKIGWNSVVVPLCLEQLVIHYAHGDRSNNYPLGIHSVLVSFNNIFAPCLATMAVDLSCFQAQFIPPADTTTEFTYELCDLAPDRSSECLHSHRIVEKYSFAPPFLYVAALSVLFLSLFLFDMTLDTRYPAVVVGVFACVLLGIQCARWVRGRNAAAAAARVREQERGDGRSTVEMRDTQSYMTASDSDVTSNSFASYSYAARESSSAGQGVGGTGVSSSSEGTGTDQPSAPQDSITTNPLFNYHVRKVY